MIFDVHVYNGGFEYEISSISKMKNTDDQIDRNPNIKSSVYTLSTLANLVSCVEWQFRISQLLIITLTSQCWMQ